MEKNPNDMKAIKEKIIEKAKKEYIAPLGNYPVSDECHRRIENPKDFETVDFAKLKRLSFSSDFRGEIPVLPKFESLDDLSFFCGITIEQLDQIDLNGVKRLCAFIKSTDSNKIIIKSNTLESLYISFRDEDRNIHIDFDGAKRLTVLDVRGKNTYSFSGAKSLSHVERFTIQSGRFIDFEWLGEMQNLRRMNLYNSAIDNFAHLTLPESLKELDLYGSEINRIENVGKLSRLNYLGIYRVSGEITNFLDEIKSLNIERLICNEIDKYKDSLREGVDTHYVIFWTNSFVRRLYDKSETVNPYTRKIYANATPEEVYEDRFFFYLRREIDEEFAKCSPRGHRFTAYDVSLKKWFVAKMEEVYPFFDFTEFHRQIATEEIGFQKCVDTVKGNGFNFISSEGIFRVCFRSTEDKKLNIRMLSMRDFVDKKRKHTSIWKYGNRIIDKAVHQYIPEYKIKEQGMDIVFLDYYGNTDTRKLEIAAVVAIAMHHYNIHLEDDVVVAGELNSKAKISRWEFSGTRYLDGLNVDKLILFTTQKKHPVSYGTTTVEKFADIASFVAEYHQKQE